MSLLLGLASPSQAQQPAAGLRGALSSDARSAVASAPAVAPTLSPDISPAGERQVSLSLKDLGVSQPLILQTTRGEAG
ncbi:hypothetical protein, partial [Neisseria gonorrhoeae]|uniref:hypothetical protein n=1 Tax=Neisseria gonorrhoeae TaxID=485 RepID=UPI00384FE389